MSSLDILYKKCKGSFTVVVDDDGASVTGATVSCSGVDRDGNAITELTSSGLTDNGDGTYTLVVPDTFDPPVGVAKVHVISNKSGAKTEGDKFIEVKELLIP